MMDLIGRATSRDTWLTNYVNFDAGCDEAELKELMVGEGCAEVFRIGIDSCLSQDFKLSGHCFICVPVRLSIRWGMSRPNLTIPGRL